MKCSDCSNPEDAASPQCTNPAHQAGSIIDEVKAFVDSLQHRDEEVVDKRSRLIDHIVGLADDATDAEEVDLASLLLVLVTAAELGVEARFLNAVNPSLAAAIALRNAGILQQVTTEARIMRARGIVNKLAGILKKKTSGS